MSGEGLHIPVDADDKKLRQLAAALRTTKKEAVDAAKALKEVQRNAGNPFAGGHGGGHGGHRGGMLHGLARLTRGTEFGHFAHMGANVQGFGGGSMGMIALGGVIGGVVLGMKALMAASERAVEAAKKEIEYRQEMANSIREAVKAADEKSIGGFKSQQGALSAIAGISGDEGVAQALELARQVGPGGVKGFAALSGMPGGLKAGDLAGARRASETGQISFEQAADMIASGKVRSGMDPRQLATALVSQQTGRRLDEGDIDNMRERYAASNAGKMAWTVDTNEAATMVAMLTRVLEQGRFGSAMQQMGKDTNAITDPEGTARSRMEFKYEEINEKLDAAANAQWRIVAFFEDIMRGVGGSGSARTQANSERAAQTAP